MYTQSMISLAFSSKSSFLFFLTNHLCCLATMINSVPKKKRAPALKRQTNKVNEEEVEEEDEESEDEEDGDGEEKEKEEPIVVKRKIPQSSQR